MPPVTRRTLLGSLLAVPALSGAEDGWIPLFDGRSLDGWKASETAGAWKASDGMLVFDGGRSHLFYNGKVRDARFKNFELKVEVLAKPLTNSGVYFHTAYQEKGFPADGFEVQVANTATGEGTYRERKKTGSLYGVRDVYKQFAKDNEWFQMHVVVRGKRVQVYVNGMMTVDYVEPTPPVKANERGRYLHSGTFALQGHDAGSKVAFRNIMVKPLADDLPESVDRPVVDQNYTDILQLHAQNFPVVDYHVHLKGGLTRQDLLRESRRLGIQYGIAINCGVGFPTTTDAGAEEFFRSMKDYPVFVAMQAEGREWVKMFSKPTIAKFDYIFTDSMTFTDDNGKRMRTWMKDEVGEIADKQKFMETLVRRIEGIMREEPIDIYANPTFLPDVIAKGYDELWTPERIARVVEALKKADVAMEINNRYRIPSAAFIKAAKQAGVKFSFGTNNTGRNDVGRMEYSIEMVKACGLKWPDMFVPRPADQKKVLTWRGV